MSQHYEDSVALLINELLIDQSIIQLVMKFGANQEVAETTTFIPHDSCLELVHGNRGRTIIMYDSILFINTVPKGDEPPTWKRHFGSVKRGTHA